MIKDIDGSKPSTQIRINGKAPPEYPLNSKVVFLGCGKSAAFFTSLMPSGTETIILTEHPTNTDKVVSMWGYGHLPFRQTADIGVVREFITRSTIPVTIVVSTDPKRGKAWLDKLLNDREIRVAIGDKNKEVTFILPQTPNPYIKDFRKTRCPVVQFDFYPGIGGMRHEHGVTYVMAGIKEQTLYAIVSKELLDSRRFQNINTLVSHFAANQTCVWAPQLKQIELLPTNALLHTVGILAHIAEVFVNRGLADKTILEAKNSEEFFEKFKQVFFYISPQGIKRYLTGEMVGKGFYREMPLVGPNVIMDEVSSTIEEIRAKLISDNIMDESYLDREGLYGKYKACHIVNHLKGKYAEQFRQHIKKDPYQLSLGEFINQNPPYQNQMIVVPTLPDGTLNTSHRFFTEELPTLKTLLALGKQCNIPEEKLQVFENIIAMNEWIIEVHKTHQRQESRAKL